MDKEGDGYLTSQDNRRILRHGAPMRLGANKQRGAQSASLEDGTLCLQFRGKKKATYVLENINGNSMIYWFYVLFCEYLFAFHIL